MAVDSGKALPSHKPHDMKGYKHQSTDMMPKEVKEIAVKSSREVTRKPKDITNKQQQRDVANVDVKYYPKKSHHAVDRSQNQVENHTHVTHMESSKVTEYISNDIQVMSHKLEPIQLRTVPNQDSIQVTSHKITPNMTPNMTSNMIPDIPSNMSSNMTSNMSSNMTPNFTPSDQQQDSPSQRLLRRKQQNQVTTATKPPEVYLLDLDEVKVHKVKRIFKIFNKNEEETPRRCHSEERARRRTWHPTDTDRSTRSDGDVVTGRAVRAADDFGSPLAQDRSQERSSRPRQRKSAFMESIQSFFGSRKSTSSPVKFGKSSPPKTPTSPQSAPCSMPQSPVTPVPVTEVFTEENHIARAVGGKYQGGQGQLKYDRVRHLAEENNPRSPQRPKSWDKSVVIPTSPLAEVQAQNNNNKSSSLPPNQQPPKADFDDKNHVIFGMGEKTFKRFSNYLTIYDDPPESRV